MASGDKFYIADKATLDGVNEKIGNTNDTQSSSTMAGSIFAKLNYLVSKMVSVYSWCNNTYSWVSSMLSKVGSAADTGGTATAGTVMGKLNDVIVKNGKIRDSDGGFLLAVATLEGAVMPEVSRSEYIMDSFSIISVDNTSIFGYDYYAHQIVKLDKITFARTGETLPQTTTLVGFIVDDAYIYCLDRDNTKKIFKFSKSSMLKVSESSGAYSRSTHIGGMCMDDSYIYLHDDNLQKVLK